MLLVMKSANDLLKNKIMAFVKTPKTTSQRALIYANFIISTRVLDHSQDGKQTVTNVSNCIRNNV